jgi:hypothetical protein
MIQEQKNIVLTCQEDGRQQIVETRAGVRCGKTNSWMGRRNECMKQWQKKTGRKTVNGLKRWRLDFGRSK